MPCPATFPTSNHLAGRSIIRRATEGQAIIIVQSDVAVKEDLFCELLERPAGCRSVVPVSTRNKLGDPNEVQTTVTAADLVNKLEAREAAS